MDKFRNITLLVLVASLGVLSFLYSNENSITGMAVGGNNGSSNIMLIGIILILVACFISVHMIVKRK